MADTKKKMNTNTLSIYGYSCYRSYLHDYYLQKKSSERGYSYRSFSKACGFSSPNVLKLIIDGKRNIGPKSLHQITQGLALSGPMAKYFHALVEWNHATDAEIKKIAYAKLLDALPAQKRHELDEEQTEYLRHWIYPTIREMAELSQFRCDPYWIIRNLQGDHSIKDVERAISFLLQAKFLAKEEDKIRVTNHVVISSDEVKSQAIRNYHKSVLQQAITILDLLPIEEREFGALTLSLPKEAIPELKSKLKEIRQDLHKWALKVAEESGKDSVIQINIQMYPSTK